MKILLSPAKSLNENVEFNGLETSQIVFPNETERLAKKLGKLSARGIGKLMDVSKDIAELNFDRYQQFSTDFTKENSYPAGYLFSGAAYQGLDFPTLSKEAQLRGQERLRILSGLYGILKPFDLIQPYRLEMGSKFKVTPKMTNLYKFWGNKIQQVIESELKEEGNNLLVNLASSEYFKAANLGKMKNVEVITPVFKDRNKKGEYKVNMQFAKLSRGRMTRFILEENIVTSEPLKAFDAEGYYFSPQESGPNEFVFLRD